jgi:uncharacterized protein
MKLPFGLNRLGLSIILVSIVSLIAVAVGTWFYFSQRRVEHLTIAAGGATGDSFVISTALKTVIERHNPNLRITVKETGGTSDSLKLLEARTVELAAAQADVPAGDDARSVAVLFPDTFQLAVHKGSSIRTFADLKGRRIALPQNGGQFKSFLAVAGHFGLVQSDFEFVGKDDKSSDQAFEAGIADAIFRVRVLSNNAILRMVGRGNIEFLPIDQAAAMQIRIPAYIPSVIPQGAYSGSPAMPPQDLPTVSVERVLLTHSGVSEETIRTITTALVEYRHEVALAIPDSLAEIRPLLASVKQPNTQSGLGIAIHPGAKAYYEKDVPNFFQQNADYVGLWVTLALLMGSWVWEGKRWFESRRKNLADKYNHDVVGLIDRAHSANTVDELEVIRMELLQVLVKAVRDLDQGRVNHDGFQSFHAIWQIATGAVRERSACLDISNEPTDAPLPLARAVTHTQ